MMPSADKIGKVNDHAPASGPILFSVRREKSLKNCSLPSSKETDWSSFSGESGRASVVHRGYVPVPDKPAFCGLPPPLSLTETAAALAPVAVGLNFTMMEQLFPAARLVPQLWV